VEAPLRTPAALARGAFRVNNEPLRYFNKDRVKHRSVFEWGYKGGGPGQLAASILADYFGEKLPMTGANPTREEYQTMRYYQDFQNDFVQWLPYDRWEISEDEITEWLEEQKNKPL
jgi:hypothetical protein